MTDDIPINPKTGKPYERRKYDEVTDKKINEVSAFLTRRTTIFFSGVAVWVLIVTAFVVINTIQQSDQSDSIRMQADSIQQERYDGYLKSCFAQNARNVDAKKKVIRLYPPGPEQESRFATIDALQPYVEDCRDYARDRVKE